jgi:hypothetical protein
MKANFNISALNLVIDQWMQIDSTANFNPKPKDPQPIDKKHPQHQHSKNNSKSNIA